jgi:DNA processing protein
MTERTAPIGTSPAAAARDEQRAAAALAAFPAMTTARLWALRRCGSWRHGLAVASGLAPPSPQIAAMFDRTATLADRWRRHASRVGALDVFDRCVALGIDVVLPTSDAYPWQLRDDPQSPAVLFTRGDVGVLDARRVAVIGTRGATQRGRQTAARFGFELAVAGVAVVSGLARGIDGAAHRGALAALDADLAGAGAPIAVVGNGLDTPYPASNAGVWEAVAAHGVLISEWPPGTAPDAWRFPRRNRILAALSEVLVVVESRESGGSLITANEAASRGVEVFAVPGPIDARASAGTNALLRDGAAPAIDTGELLIALGLSTGRARPPALEARPQPSVLGRRILELIGTEPTHADHLVQTLARPLTEVALELARLESAGWLRQSGGWFEVIDAWGHATRT